jgi:prolycopene isomerase
MRFHRESAREVYDAIVIGSGIGGLTTAALLAKEGRRVLVVERHDRPGGYAHGFRRRRYRFDSAVHLIGGCEPTTFEGGGLVDRLLCSLGVRDRCRFVRIDPFYTSIFPGFELRVPGGLDEFVSAYTERFPAEEKGLRQLVQLCLDIRQEAQRAPDFLLISDLVRLRKLYPTLVRYHRATLGKVMDEQLSDPRLKALFATLWPYLGLPPSRVSFLYWATMLMSYVADGAYYCEGGFQRLADALVHALEAEGSELLLKSTVRRITIENGRACGVVLDNGQRVAAPVVVSNADARQTFEELVTAEHLPAGFLTKLRRMRPSVSAFVVYAAASLDPRGYRAAHENFLYTHWEHDRHYADVCRGTPSWLSVTVPTLVDPALAPPGEHLFVLTTLLSADPARSWRTGKQALVEHMLQGVEARFPGFRRQLRFCEGASPRTMERYTLNQGGAIYGWDLAPDQVGPGRLPSSAPVEGLFLVGHWTRPGGGVYGVMTSGVDVARRISGIPSDLLLAPPRGLA